MRRRTRDEKKENEFRMFFFSESVFRVQEAESNELFSPARALLEACPGAAAAVKKTPSQHALLLSSGEPQQESQQEGNERRKEEETSLLF